MILIFPVFSYFALFTGNDNWQNNEPVWQKIKKKLNSGDFMEFVILKSGVFFSFEASMPDNTSIVYHTSHTGFADV